MPLSRSDLRVVVIGGGWAGMAAAVRLAEAGVRVVVLEGARELGGRARRVTLDDVALDNGLHILLGAYRETLSLIDLTTGAGNGLRRLPLHLEIGDQFRLSCPRLPGPLSLLVALAAAKGLSTSDKASIARFLLTMRWRGFRIRPQATVATLLQEGQQSDNARRFLWDPLCLAALNTDPALASAQVLLNVLRDSLFGQRGDHDLVLPTRDLTAVFPEPARAYVDARGGEVHVGTTVEEIVTTAQGFELRTRTRTWEASHVICATDPARARSLLAALPDLSEATHAIERLSYEPITSIYLHYADPPRLACPMLGAADSPVQWFFDRGALCGQSGWIGGVISGSRPWLGHGADELAVLAHDQLGRMFPNLAPPTRHHVIAEKRATFACLPGLLRPLQRTAVPRFYLAGDYTHCDYPATLEAATRSGTICARAILEDSR